MAADIYGRDVVLGAPLSADSTRLIIQSADDFTDMMVQNVQLQYQQNINRVWEVGSNKTFFIAALMAMRNSRLAVLAGALAALWIMTALSAFIGKVSSEMARLSLRQLPAPAGGLTLAQSRSRRGTRTTPPPRSSSSSAGARSTPRCWRGRPRRMPRSSRRWPRSFVTCGCAAMPRCSITRAASIA